MGRLLFSWHLHHLNGPELLGLEPGTLSLQRSAGECMPLSSFRKVRLVFWVFFSPFK